MKKRKMDMPPAFVPAPSEPRPYRPVTELAGRAVRAVSQVLVFRLLPVVLALLARGPRRARWNPIRRLRFRARIARRLRQGIRAVFHKFQIGS